MFFKKKLLSFLVFPFLLLNSCNNGNNKETIKNIKENTKEIVPSLENIIEEKISSNSPAIPLTTKRNNEYLLANIRDNAYLHDKEYLREKISEFFESSKHTEVKRDTNAIPTYKVQELSLGQLQRIYLMYNYLKNPSSLQTIGKIIEDDVLDMCAEHGGIIIFKKRKICFQTLESYVKRDTSNNDVYGVPDKVDSIPNIGLFHLHATSHNEEAYSSPSSRDIIISYFTTHVNNEAHDFLITPLNRGTFNIDYYGGHKEINPVTKVFDLGNYNYNTLKIFK